MEKTISAIEAGRDFDKVLQAVEMNGDNVVVEKDGKRVAVVVRVALYEQWQRARKEFFDMPRQSAERANMTEEEAYELIEEVKQEIRSRQRVVKKMREMASQADMSEEAADALAAEAVAWARANKDK